jgi:hypothetical protein
MSSLGYEMQVKTSITVCSAIYCQAQEQKYAYQPCCLMTQHQLHSPALLLELVLSSMNVFSILKLIIVNWMFVDPCIIVKFINKKPTRCNSVSKFIIPYLYEAQHVSGEKAPIIRSLKLHWQPLIFHTWKIVGRVVGGLCQVQCLTTSNSYTYKQPSTYKKPEAASAVLGS